MAVCCMYSNMNIKGLYETKNEKISVNINMVELGKIDYLANNWHLFKSYGINQICHYARAGS